MYSTCTRKNTCKSAMLNIWAVTKTSLHISSLIPFLDSPAPINSFLLQQENGCLRHLIMSARQHFLLSKLPSILLDTSAQCDNDFRTAQCGRRDHPLKSAHVGPIRQPPRRGVSRRRCLSVAVQLPIWMADWRRQGDLVWSLSGPGRDNPAR